MGTLDGQAGPCLQVDGDAAHRFPLDRAVVHVGRDPASEVVLADPAASWRHARVVRRGPDLVVEDLGSLNGTWLNGRRLGGPEALRPGDRLRIGTTTFLLVPEVPPAGPGAPPRVQVEEARRARDVGAIVATPYFQQLRRAAARRRDTGPPPAEGSGPRPAGG